MSSYTFQSTCTNSLTVIIEAKSEDEAWKIFELKIEILESMGVFMPRLTTWSVVTMY